jgi:flagellar basal-body rod modification protein FlgD
MSTTPVTAASTTSTTPTTSVVNNSSQLGKDDFLKLLVAQLKNQDPANPMDSSQFMGQLAQFSSLEQMTNMAQGIDSLGTSQSVSQGVALIGHQLVYSRSDGSTATGVADGISVVNGQVQIDVQGETVLPGSILGVGPLATSTDTSTSTTSPSASSGTTPTP